MAGKRDEADLVEAGGVDAKADALMREGRRLLDAGLPADAVELLSRAGAAGAAAVECARWLAEAELAAGRLEAAQHTLDEALAQAPHRSELIILRAETALRGRALGDAEALLDVAIDVAPPDAALLAERARVSMHAGRIGAARRDIDRSLELDPANLEAQSLRIVLASYEPGITTAGLKTLQRRWRGPACDGPALAPRPRDRGPLRVGYVCCGLYQHPAAGVVAAVLFNHDPAEVEAHCYSGSRRRDAVTMKLRMAVKGWRSITGLDDAAAAAQIRADGIDILVDLDGHFPHNRLGIFTLRAAPIQVSAWGYVAGPGTDGIDYLLTDTVIAPPDEAAVFPERLVRLACAQPYAPELMPRPAGAQPPPLRGAGPIRFGCFNRLDKLTEQTLGLWGAVLSAIPEATLLLKDRFFIDAARQATIAEALVRAGAAPAQLRFEAGEAHSAYLGAFDRIDVALDPAPVSGGVTTIDGLMQGVPAVTLVGAAPTGRITASILTYAGLREGVCATREDYVRVAVGLAGDPARLADLRKRTLEARARFSPSAMRTYAAEVEAAYREMWDRCLTERGGA